MAKGGGKKPFDLKTLLIAIPLHIRLRDDGERALVTLLAYAFSCIVQT